MAKEKAGSSKEMTISGYVEEVELEDGNTGVMISDGDYEFMVVMDKRGKQLLDYLDEEVEVTGLVTKKPGGVREIKVTQYRLLDEDGEDEGDDYFDEDEDEGDDYLDDDRRG